MCDRIDLTPDEVAHVKRYLSAQDSRLRFWCWGRFVLPVVAVASFVVSGMIFYLLFHSVSTGRSILITEADPVPRELLEASLQLMASRLRAEAVLLIAGYVLLFAGMVLLVTSLTARRNMLSGEILKKVAQALLNGNTETRATVSGDVGGSSCEQGDSRPPTFCD